ncbi:hypothetical protein Sgou_14360 [Streptomyces gougerotii]|uniref:Uncharacterized protein n=1 Tax=Streptomyces gougerotii TaxID=53448 RepID=A0A8H9HH24_9ACTN|nr:hypothetical protein Sgou_14360 [Streptomyces gougerotii]GGU64671.1 hypothetical protein GCM10010227_17680 [Streptomyces gougerotii]
MRDGYGPPAPGTRNRTRAQNPGAAGSGSTFPDPGPEHRARPSHAPPPRTVRGTVTAPYARACGR